MNRVSLTGTRTMRSNHLFRSPPRTQAQPVLVKELESFDAAASREPRDGFFRTAGTLTLLGVATLAASGCVPQSSPAPEVQVDHSSSQGGMGTSIDLLNEEAPTAVIGSDGNAAHRIGRTIVRSDGTTSTDIGNVRINSDGTTSTRIGNTVINSDGTTSTRIGNTVVRSDGTTSTRIGNTTIHSDGTTSTRIGNTVINSDGTVSFEF